MAIGGILHLLSRTDFIQAELLGFGTAVQLVHASLFQGCNFLDIILLFIDPFHQHVGKGTVGVRCNFRRLHGCIILDDCNLAGLLIHLLSHRFGYRDGIEACCAGGDGFLEECRKRSPITYAEEIAKATVKIFTGKWDASVPPHHGLDLFIKIFKEHPEAKVYFEMFDGGHEMPLDLAFGWVDSLLRQEKRKTQVPG